MVTYEASSAEERLRELRQDIVGLDQEVPLLDGSRRPCVFLDNAASTPALGAVQAKVDELLRWYSSVHRGASFKSLLSTEAYEKAREVVANFVGADPQADVVIFGKNTTEAINKLAHRLPLQPDDVVLCTVMEHHSNDLPWRGRAQIDYVGLMEDDSLDVEDLARKLEKYEGRVRLVATTGASNVSGYTPPIYEMAELAHRHGARIFVDCAQLAPHRELRMGPLGSAQRLDFVALSAHKMYAPYGTGALVGPRAIFEQGGPEYRGGGTIDLVTLDEVRWAGPPERDEAGSPNLIGAVALAASMRRLQQVGMKTIADHERQLTAYALRRLGALEDVWIYGSHDPHRLDDRLGVISFNVRGMHHGKVAAILGFEGGIAVRHGCFCAHPYVLELLDVKGEAYATFREQLLQGDRSEMPGLVRISFGCYNNEEDVDHLVQVLRRVIDRTYQGEYVVDESSGTYLPKGFDLSIMEEAFTI